MSLEICDDIYLGGQSGSHHSAYYLAYLQRFVAHNFVQTSMMAAPVQAFLILRCWHVSYNPIPPFSQP